MEVLSQVSMIVVGSQLRTSRLRVYASEKWFWVVIENADINLFLKTCDNKKREKFTA